MVIERVLLGVEVLCPVVFTGARGGGVLRGIGVGTAIVGIRVSVGKGVIVIVGNIVNVGVYVHVVELIDVVVCVVDSVAV
jgi:hypothetical protein